MEKTFTNKEFKKSITKQPFVYDCGSLIGELFRSRDLAHIVHLNTTSLGEHKALKEFYDEILDLTDTFAETAFGVYGRSKITIPESTVVTDFSSYLKELRMEVVEHREEIKETNLQNILDEILSLIDHTKYLLTLK